MSIADQRTAGTAELAQITQREPPSGLGREYATPKHASSPVPRPDSARSVMARARRHRGPQLYDPHEGWPPGSESEPIRSSDYRTDWKQLFPRRRHGERARRAFLFFTAVSRINVRRLRLGLCAASRCLPSRPVGVTGRPRRDGPRRGAVRHSSASCHLRAASALPAGGRRHGAPGMRYGVVVEELAVEVLAQLPHDQACRDREGPAPPSQAS